VTRDGQDIQDIPDVLPLVLAFSIYNKQQSIPEQSLRDVFNDVSKYIRNISISLNAVFP
jgi:hypothetical protein